MEQIKNAQSENIPGGREERLVETQREGLGHIFSDSSSDGNEQIATCVPDSTGKGVNWKLTPVRDTNAGKILERIESLETRHIKYVDSHQSRLSARLEESRQEKEEFLQEANQIKSDIYHLAIAQQETNGNGRIN